MPFIYFYRLEDIFYDYGVDVVLEAHEHSYERLWPMYKNIVLAKNYTNPPAPVQLVTGAAGSKHGVDLMNPKNGLYSVYKALDKLFSKLGIYSSKFWVF